MPKYPYNPVIGQTDLMGVARPLIDIFLKKFTAARAFKKGKN
jgi:hypothetical protein